MVEPLREVVEALIVEEHVVFTLPDLCRACGADAAQLQALVSEGLLHPAGNTPSGWRFSGHSLARARTALRLNRELDIELAAVALVMDLLDEIEVLRDRLAHELPGG